MSKISVDVSSARIPVLQVGYQGENEVTDVLFDISSWITEFGEGVAQLRVKRPGNSEEESYVLSLTITDGIAVWTVSETDTFNKGNGKVQLSYLVGNIVKKAVIYPYKVGKSIVGADNPVDPFDSWIERSKAWAIGETLDGDNVPETDETYQNNAKYYAEQADILGSAQVVLAAEKVTLAAEQVTLATEKADAAAASEAAVNGVSTQLTDRMSAIETEQAVQDARMDTFTSLPAGSTSGNAELADIRVGADGTTYDTAGNAVRGQIGELKSDLGLLAEACGVDISMKTVNSVDEMTDTTKEYILQSTGTIWEYGLTKIPAFTNLATVITEGFRLNSSGGLTAEAGSTTVEDYIDFVTGDVVRVKGLTLGTKNIALYDASKTPVSSYKPVVGGVVDNVTTTLNDGVYTLTSGTSARVKYLRISGILSGTADDVIVTRNEEITYTDGYAWVDTGLVPEGGGENYVTLLVKVNQNTSDISEVSNRVTALETGSGTLTIPSFWQNAVDECITKIKALQVGKNCITFPFFSDNHQRNGYSGVLIAYIMKECNIPYCFYGGDSISSGTIADEATMIEQDKLFDNIMSYVPNEKMCRAVGNHDGYWYDGTSKYYYGREQIYELFLREESVSQSKHFGDDGTYYYVDDIASKTRFIIMNTNKQRVDNVATGESIDSAQIDWLENKALSFDESGWAVVFIGHAPITNNFHALISNAQAVQTLITNYINGSSVNKADVVGWFSGHIHRDRFYKCDATGNDQTDAGNPVYDASNPSTNTLPFMTVTITSDATNISYDDSTKHSIANDGKSHAIDFVTINKTTRTVNLTRLGIGEDRSYTY